MQAEKKKAEKKLYGLDDHAKRATIALSTGEPVLLYGPSGSGKTILADQIAQDYKKSIKKDITIIYLQLYPEMTKGTLIGGETLRDGNIVIEPQVVATEGEKGAIFIVDECTHTTEPVLLSFNSLIEEPNITMVGSKVFKMHADTRFIFCGNYPDHTGNIPLPTSFANRLYIEDVGFPSIDDYVNIAKHYSGVDDLLAQFIAYIVENTKADDFPLSPRNVIKCSRSIKAIEGTGYRKLKDVRLTAKVTALMALLHKKDVNPEMFKHIMLSTLQAYVKTRSAGPDKIKALLW